MNPNIFLFAGEPSGDLHGSHLLARLKKQLPHYHFWGVGGPKMRAKDLQTLLLMEDFSVMGFSDVIFSLGKIIRQFKQVRAAILQSSASAVILIDYAEFNLRLAKSLRQQGYQGKIIQYISPSVWAWRKGRVQTMAKSLDLLLTIYPFEAAHFQHTSLPVAYVGNPLCEYLDGYSYCESWKEHTHIPAQEKILALFPGSRRSEIEKNLPLQLEALGLLHKQSSAMPSIAISCPSEEHRPLMASYVNKHQANLPNTYLVPQHFTYELMRDSHIALAKSGTVTLELALHARPTAVLYKMTKLNYLIAKYVIGLNLPHYCMVNILAQGEVFPECIEKELTAKAICQHLKALLTEERFTQCQAECQELRLLLQSNLSASSQAAEAILQRIHS